MNYSVEGDQAIVKPAKLTYEEIIKDLCSIPINQKDVLFDKSNTNDTKLAGDGKFYEKIEKYVLINSNLELESENIDSDLSVQRLESEFEKIEEKLQKLQCFIEISEKFLSISNRQN